MLRRVMGQQGAAAAALFGEVFDGEAAERVGLAYRCVDDDVLLDTSISIAARAASVPPALSRRTKETLEAMALVQSHDDAVDVELDAQLWSMEQPEFAERLRATQERIKTPRP
jgi:enoyl-CoA hydratase